MNARKVQRVRSDCRFRCGAISRGAACCNSARRTWLRHAGRPAACVTPCASTESCEPDGPCLAAASASAPVAAPRWLFPVAAATAQPVCVPPHRWAWQHAMGRHRPDDIMRIGQSIAGFVANDRQLRSNRLSKVEPAIADAIRRKTWEDGQSRPTASCAWITTLAMQQQLAMHVDGGRLPPSVAIRGELQRHQCRRRRLMPQTHHRSYASRRSRSSLPGRPARPPCRPLPRRGRGV